MTLAAVALLCIFGPVIWSGPANTFNLSALEQPPSSLHPMGTDALGRDILARVLVAGRLSVTLAALATGLGAFGGVILGTLPAVLGRRMGRLVGAIINGSVAFPGLLLALFMDVIFGLGARGATLALALAAVPTFARLTQTLAARVAGSDYIAAARLSGLPRWRMMVFHVAPNIAEPILVNGTVAIGGTLLAFSGLSFLGLGIQPPDYDWGRLLNEGLARLYINPEAALAPGAAILLTGLSFQLAGEALASLIGRQSHTRSARTIPNVPSAGIPAPGDFTPAGLGSRTSDSDLLRVEGLSVWFASPSGLSWPVRDVSFSVGKGEVLGLVGESGSGKSLTAQVIARIEPPGAVVKARQLRYKGHDLLETDSPELSGVLGTSLVLVLQDPLSSLNPALRIERQLTEAVEFHKGVPHAAARERAEAMLRAVRISGPSERLGQHPHELSGGMRQRVVIAMGLMVEPELVIADEPTTSLDVTVQREVLDRLRALTEQSGTAVIHISHDIALIAQTCKRVVVMYGGRLVEEVEADRLMQSAVHPYTRLLLATVPDMAVERSQPLATIAGRPADPRELGLGCPFAPRCPRALSQCSQEFPSRVPLGPNQWVACWNPHPESSHKS